MKLNVEIFSGQEINAVMLAYAMLPYGPDVIEPEDLERRPVEEVRNTIRKTLRAELLPRNLELGARSALTKLATV